jgi:dihydropteroate synthase
MKKIYPFDFNTRVLEEKTPPGLLDKSEDWDPSFPDEPVHMAFSRNASPLLEAAGVPFTPGAGGVRARIDQEALKRLSRLQEKGGGRLQEAALYAYQGWSRNHYSWLLAKDRVLALGGRPRLMGILNVTPDSFSDGGLYCSHEAAVNHARAMVDAGAEIIDVGGESTRPGSEPVPASIEIQRTIPVVRSVVERTGVPVSIDTTKAEVAQEALKAGASILNDISGVGFDPHMAHVAAKSKAGVVIMHIRGTPKDMQKNPLYADTLADICLTLGDKTRVALEAGIDPERIILDPGIGFGKRLEDNLRLLGQIGELRSLGFPLLYGASRKSFLGLITGRESRERDLESTACSVMAALSGVQVLRVHDVRQNLLCLQVVEAVLQEREMSKARGE